MSEQISLQHLLSGRDSDAGTLRIEARDPELYGKEARLEVVVLGNVKRSGGIDARTVVLEEELKLGPSLEVPLPALLLEHYRFTGQNLSIEIFAELSVKLGLLQKMSARVDLGPVEAAQPDVKALTDPKDSVNLAMNFKVLPFDAKVKVAGLGIVGIFVVLLGLLVGAHDQTVPESEAYFFDQHSSKGKSESPLLKGLLAGGLFGGAIYLAIMYQLGRYVSLEIESPGTLGQGAKIPIARLVRGKTHAAIGHAQLKVVAYNLERGVYRVRRNKRNRKESFKGPVRAVCLFEQELRDLPAGAELAPYLSGEVDFGLAYRDLLPPQMLDASTGIDLSWEVQFLHQDFVDHEIEGDANIFDRARFSPRKWS